MALTAEQEASRQFAFSGNATLADIPGLLRRLTPPPSNSPNINLSLGGGEDPARARGGGSNITNQFGVIPAINTVEATSGGGADLFGVLGGGAGFTDPGFLEGRGGPDAEGGNVGLTDFSEDDQSIANAFGALTGIPGIGSALGKFGIGVLGPTTPAVGTRSFRGVTNATAQARALNEAGITAAEAAGAGGPAGPGSTGGVGESGVGSGRSGAPGGPGTGGSGSDGGGGDSGGGAGGDSDGGGGPAGGRDTGGIVSENEVPGVIGGPVFNQRLQEGEFVIRREAVQALGPALLNKLNNAGTRRLSDLPGVPPRKPGGRR